MISSVELSQFQTQQVYCVRDRHGSITEGGQVQYVFFFLSIVMLAKSATSNLKAISMVPLVLVLLSTNCIGIKFMSNLNLGLL